MCQATNIGKPDLFSLNRSRYAHLLATKTDSPLNETNDTFATKHDS